MITVVGPHTPTNWWPALIRFVTPLCCQSLEHALPAVDDRQETDVTKFTSPRCGALTRDLAKKVAT